MATNFVSPFSWMGGKEKQWSLIQEELPEKIDVWIEPFLGGGSVALNAMKSHLATHYFLNDKNNELISAFERIEEADYDYHQLIIPKDLDEAREFYLNHPRMEVRFWADNILSFNGLKRAGWYESRLKGNFKQSRIERLVSTSKLLKENIIYFSNLDYLEFVHGPIRAHNPARKAFVFLDPPYFYSQSKRIYGDDESVINYQELVNLCEFLDERHIDFLITLDDSEFINTLFQEFKIIKKEWKYTSSNRKTSNCKIGKELFIKNY